MGMGIAERLAADGHKVLALDVQAEKLDATAARIAAAGGTVLPLP
jgi:NAD(P)-dependent dehydrogenase (short-subunit alcohol dehydrogenase family)